VLRRQNTLQIPTLNGDSRAYPHRIMDWHEMANDVVGGVPVALAY
jgi:hypothetical protein